MARVLIPTPRDDKVDHMPVSGTRMHPSGLAFILLLEHGVRHYQFELTASRSSPYWSCISQSHVYSSWPEANSVEVPLAFGKLL